MTEQRPNQDWGVFLDNARITGMRDSGAWHDRVLTDFFDRNAEVHPDAVAVVAASGGTGRITRVSYRELSTASDRIARGLHALGIRKGDIVSFQLQNCWEFLAIVLACIRIGAVTHPIMPILRHRELIFMARLTGARLLVVPDRFRGFDFLSMAQEVATEVPTLEHTFAVGGSDSSFFQHFLAEARNEEPGFAPEQPGGNDLMQLIFTSGTTGEPKGSVRIRANDRMG